MVTRQGGGCGAILLKVPADHRQGREHEDAGVPKRGIVDDLSEKHAEGRADQRRIQGVPWCPYRAHCRNQQSQQVQGKTSQAQFQKNLKGTGVKGGELSGAGCQRGRLSGLGYEDYFERTTSNPCPAPGPSG